MSTQIDQSVPHDDITSMSNTCSKSTVTSPTSAVDIDSAAASVPAPQFSIKQHPPINLMELVQAITENVGDKCDLTKLHAIMSSYDTSLNEWRRFALYDPTKKYTRNLIATDGQHFSLMLLCWNPKQESPVHNHSGSECFMRVVDGSVQESQYERHDNEAEERAAAASTSQHDCDEEGTPMKLLRRGSYQPGAVLFINDSIGLHKINNVSDQPAATLHCYLPPYEECNCYDEQTGHIKRAFTTFYSEHGELVEH